MMREGEDNDKVNRLNILQLVKFKLLLSAEVLLFPGKKHKTDYYCIIIILLYYYCIISLLLLHNYYIIIA